MAVILKRILNNATLMSWTSYIVQFGSVLVIFPLLVKVYSPLEQSLWWLMNTIIGLAMLADSGFGAVLLRGVTYFASGADYLPRTKEEFEANKSNLSFHPNVDKLADLFTTARRIYLYLGLIMLIILLTLGPLIMWNVMEMAHHRIDFWLCYILMLPNCLILIMTVRWRSFLRGLNFVAKEAKINSSIGALRLLGFIVILSFGLPPVYLVICLLAESSIKYIYLKVLIYKWFRENNKSIKNRKYFDREIFKSLWTATWKEGLIQWGNYLLFQGNSIIMAQVNNAQLMANFLLTTRILTVIASVSEITLFSNIPKIYSFAAKNDRRNMRITAAGYMFLGISIMVISFLLLILYGNKALTLLNKQSQLVPLGILIIMVISQLLDTHATFHAGIYISTNHVPFVIPTLVSGFLILGLGFIIMPIYGLIGLILLKFIVQFSFNYWYAMILSLRLLHWPFRKYLYEFPIMGSTFVFNKFKSFFAI